VSSEHGAPRVIASYFDVCRGWYEFYVAEYKMKSRRVTTLVVLTRELYQTKIFTNVPESTLRLMVQQLARSPDPTNPVELVYNFGGTVRGEAVRILNTNPLH
jgi:hypothetical protein